MEKARYKTQQNDYDNNSFQNKKKNFQDISVLGFYQIVV